MGTSGTTSGSGQTTPVSYIHLPAVGAKQAPPKFRGHHRDLTGFIQRFKHVCTQYNVTESEQMCFGILLYCSRSVKNTIENLESYQKKDFDALVKELQWFYDGEREASEHHLGHLDDFSRAWREEQIANLEMFKQYHREFVRLAGSLKKTSQIEDRAYNKWFWMGLHPSTRESLEKRMKEDDPTLDIRTPFPTSTIAKAAEHIFDRNRFDKDLLEEERTLPRGSPEGIAAHWQRCEKI